MYFASPLKGFPLELGVGARGQKTRMMGVPDGQRSFKIGLAVYRQTDRQTPHKWVRWYMMMTYDSQLFECRQLDVTSSSCSSRITDAGQFSGNSRLCHSWTTFNSITVISTRNCTLCRTNPRQLKGHICTGWHHTMGQACIIIDSLLWVQRQSRNTPPSDLTLDFLNRKSTSYDRLSSTTAVPSFKSFRSGIFVLSC